eukprot:TRINITY_DN529_c0_g1_i1.p1 TRINITY_DN529_c0_g1~~TRINITY_DN529_c0_g1_i1.p1  ORF type:complete len:537 (+),score=200.54 TRINITY_DN529_c0_g1_i1:55-1665(+)
MRVGLALLALVGSVGAQTGEFLIKGTETLSAGTYRHYLGYARGGRYTVNTAGCTADASKLTFRLAYAINGTGECTTLNSTGFCATTTPDTAQCVSKTREAIADCVSVSTVQPTSVAGTPLAATTWFYSPLGTTLDYKGHGTDKYQWFLEYILDADITTAGCSLTANGKAYAPEEGFCVAPVDTEWKSDSVTYFASGAELPRHIGDNYLISTKAVGGDLENGSLSTTDPSVTFGYWDLGLGPRIELSCLRVYTTPSQVAGSGCEALQTGYGAAAGGSSPSLWGFDLMVAPDCRNPAGSEFCCALSTKDSCQTQTDSNGVGCVWVDFGIAQVEDSPRQAECYSANDVRYIDLKDSGVIGKTGEQFVFDSDRANTPDSSLITRPHEKDLGWNTVQNNRWLLRYQNKDTAPSTTCPAAVTVSTISHTTGGICEPSARALCDATEAKCGSANQTLYPRYWRQNDLVSEVSGILAKDEYLTCNCLKQKEICYRKNGCLSTKKYELILQNCLEAGCGNYCNSPAAQVGVSMVALLFAFAALLL